MKDHTNGLYHFSSKLVCLNNTNSVSRPYQSTTQYSVAEVRHTHRSKTPTNFKSFIISADVQCKAGDSSTAVPQGKLLHFGCRCCSCSRWELKSTPFILQKDPRNLATQTHLLLETTGTRQPFIWLSSVSEMSIWRGKRGTQTVICRGALRYWYVKFTSAFTLPFISLPLTKT